MKKLNQKGIAHLEIIAALVVVVVVAVVGYMVYKNQKSSKQNSSTVSTNSPAVKNTSQDDDKVAVKKAAKDHFTLVYAKKTQEAYDVTCQKFKEQSSYDQFQSVLQKGNFYAVDLSAVDYTDVTVANNQARLKGALGPFSPNTSLQVDLLKVNNAWCVYGYRTV